MSEHTSPTEPGGGVHTIRGGPERRNAPQLAPWPGGPASPTTAQQPDIARQELHHDPAHRFLESNPEATLHITWATAGELACGPDAGGREAWRNLVRRFPVIEPDRETCWIYGQTYRYLRENGLLIGANDLWIAAAAVRAELPLVTRDEGRFRRVPGLEVVGY